MENIDIVVLYNTLIDLLANGHYLEYNNLLIKHTNLLLNPEYYDVLKNLQESMNLCIQNDPAAYKLFVEDLGYKYDLVDYLFELKVRFKLLMWWFIRRFIFVKY